MSMRQHVRTIAVSLALGLAFGTILNAQDNRPNVLFIAIDDLRPELGCYESRHIQSPHIDTFAKQGIVFELSKLLSEGQKKAQP